ncbi:PREDICTED: 7-deoxyloganetic acid glucosyltransferase-like [Ipomoea nil]|uniref:7-deoxyloganetic acid glucosyltransferase-like n=1 Tax=Ipomoea nil TaxID=35883 RepID=UPI000901F5FA|nr:PREDICTED: 7-deoxyloganetic acid glucosyltransferase-like [Ipomoea nil]
MDTTAVVPPPHVLVFPLPAQGHVNSMLKLSELLCLSDIHVTFLVTVPTHGSLLAHTDVGSRFGEKFRLETLPDGIHQDDLHTLDGFMENLNTLESVGRPFLKEYLGGGHRRCPFWPPVSCVITDGALVSLAVDVAEEFKLPTIVFQTISVAAFWCYVCTPDLIQSGELPIKGNEMDLATKVKGMESFLRLGDLPSFCQLQNLETPIFRTLVKEKLQTTRARGVIFNTFEEPILSQVRTMCPNAYAIGPVHAHLKARLDANPPSSNSLRDEDRSCLSWLENQPEKSVIYVSFGSLAVVTREQLLEIWHGLVNSGQRFLWVHRQDLVAGENGGDWVPTELEEGLKARGYMVRWAPQEAVLEHPSVGGFFTHSGWNSTLESIVAGVPMICRPCLGDQNTNSRMVEAVWKIGMDMKGRCDRVTVEKMVRDVMEKRKDEFLQRAEEVAKLAGKAVGEGGSSCSNLRRLVDDIRSRALSPMRT